MRLTVVLVVLALAPPLATAQLVGCVGPICESAEGAECNASGQQGEGTTVIQTGAGVLVLEDSCYGNGAAREIRAESNGARVRWYDVSSTSGYHERSIRVSAGPASAEWASTPSACSMSAIAPTLAPRANCLAGGPPAQPDGPWGRLLP